MIWHVAHKDLVNRGFLWLIKTVFWFSIIPLRLSDHRKWMRIVGGDTTKKILEIFPRIAYRYSSSYLFVGNTWLQRLQMVKAHYYFLNQTYDAPFFNEILDRGVVLWEMAESGHSMSISLLGPCIESEHKEGELSLSFAMDGVHLFNLAFSLIPKTSVELGPAQSEGLSELVIFIGQVQGMRDQIGLIRQATALCHAVAPQDILMSALAGIAMAWGVTGLLGVQASRQLSTSTFSHLPGAFDYAGFWARYQSHVLPGGHHFIPLPYLERPIEETASKHRRRTLTKRSFKRQLMSDVEASVAQRSRLSGEARPQD